MATHGKGDNGQIAGAHSNCNVRQVNSMQGECDDRQTIALAMATRIKGNKNANRYVCDGHDHGRAQQVQG